MGRIHSKQVCKRTAPEGECVLVDGKVNSVKDLVAAINTGSSFSKVFSELGGSKSIQSEKIGLCDGSPIEITGFMECCEKPYSSVSPDQPCVLNIPLRVSLPPLSTESNLLKLLTFDRSKKINDTVEEGSGSIKTDTTDNNHGSEMPDNLEREKKTCAVATEETNDGSENQEWLFTLYDFDDLGKITKEDIVGLFKSLYDAVDSVATLQHQGARTLKLHLTVTPGDTPKCPPDVTSANRAEVQEGHGVSEAVSSSIPDGTRFCAAPKKILPRFRCQLPSPHFHDGSSPRISRHRPLENRPITSCGGERRTNDTTTTTTTNNNNNNNNNNNLSFKNDVQNLRRQSFSEGFAGAISTDPPVADFALPAATADDVRQRGSRRRRCSGASKRLLQLDDQSLAHLIQHSMDLNGHQHSSKVRHNFNSSTSKKWTQDSNMNQKPSFCVDCPTEDSTQDRTHYLDLAGIENYESCHNCGPLISSAQPNFGAFGDEVVTNSHRKSKSKPSSLTRKHSRCISEQKTGRYSSLICKEDETSWAGVVGLARDAKPVKLESPVHLFETVSLSHYRQRHQNRERNLRRAMRQVAEWIEKEHVYRSTEERVVVVRKHEHHHVHDHFYHHINRCGNT